MPSKKNKISRAHIKHALDAQKWDLLDKLLEIDASTMDDTSVYTDTWGEWWGFLYECVLKNRPIGLRILLKHGANPKQGNWGDCLPYKPIELAQRKGYTDIADLLSRKVKPMYERKTDPPLPTLDQEEAEALQRQEEIRAKTGLVFNLEALKKK